MGERMRDEIDVTRQGIKRTARSRAVSRARKSTLEKARVSGTGPKFIRLSARAIGYRVADLDQWIATRHRASSTSE